MRFPKHVAALSLLSFFGCADDLTQLIVVIDTDLVVPAELDRVDLVVDGPTANSVDGSMALDHEGLLPLTLGLTPADDTLGPVTVTATALRGSTRVVERRVRASFARGRTLMLPIGLLRTCAGMTAPCAGADDTCLDDGTCGSIEVDSADLPAWIGRPARLPGSPYEMDAGTDAAPDVVTADSTPPPPDARVSGCPPGICDPAAQTGCTGGQTCDLFSAEVVVCRPPGAGTDGSACTSALDCDFGYSCVGFESSGQCQHLCCAGDDSVCPIGQRCIVSLGAPGSAYQACVPSGCDPVEQTGCPAADACYPRDEMGATFCIPPEGTGVQLASCGPNLYSCARGFLCFRSICLKMCRAGGGEPSCPAGTTCRAFPGSSTLGLCDSE